jgi:hypothetical protein
MDTQMAMGLIANNLHVGQHIFGFSGIEDMHWIMMAGHGCLEIGHHLCKIVSSLSPD